MWNNLNSIWDATTPQVPIHQPCKYTSIQVKLHTHIYTILLKSKH